MEFRILGALEVLDDRGGAVPLRGRRARALLAALLIRANEVVPDDRLLEDVWGGEPPASGRAALRVRISQLRKALGADGLLLTRPPGYVLHVDPAQVDARRFEGLLAEGRRRLAEGDAAAAAAALGEGLALWRGPALADVVYEPFARTESARLEELRLAALEERVEADLALGRHAGLVGELEALVAAEPLRERLRGQLMLALYRAGRQADALAAYREAREALVDELGIEPGRALQELESLILRQASSLELPATLAPAPAPPPVVPERERKLVSVVAADLAASPGLEEADDPERRTALLERYAVLVRGELEHAGGHVDGGGDAVTATFGAPVAQEDHVERAVRAALALRRVAEEEFGEALGLRLGVETGEVVVARAGERSSVSGTPLAAAARLSRAAAPGAILVGERAAASVRETFEFGPLAPAEPGSGHSGYRPLLHAVEAPGARGRGRLLPRLVGRNAELEVLCAAYARTVSEGRPRLVTVMGDAGVGKTRLVSEAWSWFAACEPEPARRTGRCLPYGRGTTYRPFAEILREELGLLATDPPETALRRLGEHQILGLTLALDVVSDLHPLAARERLQTAWAAFLSELAARRPTAILVEDLHWAHEPLLDLLERIVEEAHGPLLLVGTARPELAESRPSWGRLRGATTVWLEPLSPAESSVLLDGLEPEALDPALREVVVRRAEGNPFFLEELLAAFRDRGALEPDVPDSVHAVLAGRIDLLPPTEKSALQAASVIGRIFWRGPVRELLDGETPDFSVLEARDFVRRRSGSSLAGEPEFAFKHALTREVAYAGLPVGRRARLHARFAGWLEHLGEGRDEHAAFLAHHYAEAVRPDNADLAWEGDAEELGRLRAKARVWLRRAADISVARYDLDDAIDLYTRALELEETDAGRSELWGAMGQTYAYKHDGDGLWTAMQNAIALCPDPEARTDLSSRLALETAVRSGIWKHMPDYATVDGWIETTLELASPDSAARARALIAKGFWNPFEGSASAREASTIAERLGDVELRSHAWDARGVAEFVSGNYELGREFAERRFELLEQISDPDHRADIYAAPISGCIWSGRFGEARRLARLHDETTAPLTPHHRLHGVAILGEVEELLGNWEAIRALAPRTEATVAANVATPCVRNARSLLVTAVAHAHLGDEGTARRFEEAAEALEIEGYGIVLDVPRLQLALVREELDTVERLLLTPLPKRGWYRGWMALATIVTRLAGLTAVGDGAQVEKEAAPHLRRGTFLEPFALRSLGVVREDEPLVEDAVARFEALGLAWHAGQTRALL